MPTIASTTTIMTQILVPEVHCRCDPRRSPCTSVFALEALPLVHINIILTTIKLILRGVPIVPTLTRSASTLLLVFLLSVPIFTCLTGSKWTMERQLL
jgi:hypothetical protein